MTDRFARDPGVEAAPMKDETVLFNPANNKFCVLNATAAFVWQTLELPRTSGEIAVAITQHFSEIELKKAEHDVDNVLNELRTIDCVILAS